MRLVFWQNMLAFHQAAHLRALADHGHDVLIVADEALSEDRKAMGWSPPDFGAARIVVKPSDAEILRLVQETPQDSIHIVGGYRGYRIGSIVLQHCLRLSIRAGLMSESGDPRGWKGLARRARWTTEWLQFGRKVDFVLAMGQLGVRWFRACGYSAAKILPYGYFVDLQKTLPPIASSDSSVVELIYVGQCVHRKGIDVALRALASLKGRNWRLTILGGGALLQDLQQLTCRLGVSEQVRFMPYLPHPQVLEHIAQSDLLVLPSRFDGWGVVVNEALLCGVPVICSDRCGATDLLKASWRGQVFRSESIGDLRDLLAQWIARGKRTAEETAQIRTWARCIQGSSAAGYMLQVFDHLYRGHSRPKPPWYEAE